MRFVTEPVTRKGGRKNNEDYCDYSESEIGGGCWVVADGLGGHVGGEIASETAVRACIESFASNPRPLSEASLERHLQAAHEAVTRRQNADPSLVGMRTTIVVLVSDGWSALWGHIGDTRLYYFREGKLMERTFDHSVPQAMVDAGNIRPQDLRYHEDRNRLLRDLGGDKGIRPTIRQTPWRLRAGDKFLLCTDGFWEHITETAMMAELAKSRTPREWLASMERRIVNNAPEGHDNYTAIAVFVEA